MLGYRNVCRKSGLPLEKVRISGIRYRRVKDSKVRIILKMTKGVALFRSFRVGERRGEGGDGSWN